MSKYEDIKFSKNVSSYLSLFVIATLAILFVIAAFSVYVYVKSGIEPLDSDSTEVKEVKIEQGSTADEIGEVLEEEGIIKSGMMFEYYLKLNSITNYQAGNYELSPSMDFEKIAKTLETGRIYQEVQHRLTVPEGYSIDEIADQMAEQLPIKKKEFMDLMNDESYIKSLIEEYPDMLSDAILDEEVKFPLEGYLFPATYDIVEEEPKVKDIVEQMLDATKNNSYSVFNSSEGYTMTFEGETKELSFHEFLTLSSLVEEEATSLADRSKIASVFLNRMSETPAMPLQTDPTVLYALGEHKERTLFEDLEVEDPYNTYNITGLPPGPIASPGMESVQSTMNPSNTNYYYFLADSEGNNHFAETFEEHTENREKYINNN
ncbi:endolytic transglycosylase MltG [Salinicoccus siamensis]|uniref:Endolytic murein transglycosylase n=1 Tax=Salinicoccus siamensis TaxID=381830 RepID=A0ABV5Z3L8_9STAP